ncbi:unnamed protein product [Aphanomyces euteiches]
MGAGASVGAISKEQCQALYGDLFNEAEWSKHVVDGMVTPAKLNEVFGQLTDAFLTHDWGTDGSTHKEVSIINRLLKAKGITTWFDEEKMEGNVKKQMIHGIDNARAIVVFVTQRYIDKVGGSNAEDNCQLEFNYAARRKTATKMIPVLIDPAPSLKNPATWTGEVGFVLGGHLYLDLSAAFNDEQLMATRIDELYHKIVSIAGTPLAQRFQGLHEAVKEEQPPVVAAVSDPTPRKATNSFGSTTIPLTSLSKHQVATLLNNVACSKYSATFLENEIDGEALSGVVTVDDVKEMGVSLAAKGRVLFDKITEFKAAGVPAGLIEAKSQAEASASEPVHAATSTKMTFDQIKASLKPADWVQLYKYKLETNGRNSSGSHELKWPDPPCSVSVTSGLHVQGDIAEIIEKEWDMMMLQSLGGRLEKGAFWLNFKMKPTAGDITPLCGGYKQWFAIHITKEMFIAIECNQGNDTFIVRKQGEPVSIALETWIDFGMLMNVKGGVIQVVLGNELMDPIELEPAFHIKYDYKPTEENELYLVRKTSRASIFQGYLRCIELYSTSPASRPQPQLLQVDPSVHDMHMAKLEALVSGMPQLCNYADMTKDQVDAVSGKLQQQSSSTLNASVGRTMMIPGGSFTHCEMGTYFDGDYYGDAYNSYLTTLAGRFSELNKHKFVWHATFAPLGACWVTTMGRGCRWFCVRISDSMLLEVTLNNQTVNHGVHHHGAPKRLARSQWVDVTIKMEDKRIHVVVNGEDMDEIVLPDDFSFTAGPGDDCEVGLVNYSNAGCFLGFLKTLALWSQLS